MKKNAYTLVELLLALAIIAAVTATLIPTIGRLIPDKSKTKVLNLHTSISSAVEEILSDDTLYNCAAESDINSVNDSVGLACDAAIAGGTPQSGPMKFPNLMADKLGLVSSGNATLPFKSSNGTLWGFNKVGVGNSAYYIITVDIDGINGNNDVYSATQTSPDRFRFKVDMYGGVTPNDAMTDAYLRNPIGSNSKGDDKDAAKKFLTPKTYK